MLLSSNTIEANWLYTRARLDGCEDTKCLWIARHISLALSSLPADTIVVWMDGESLEINIDVRMVLLVSSSSSVLDLMISFSLARFRSEFILVFQMVKLSSVRTGMASKVVLRIVGLMSSITDETDLVLRGWQLEIVFDC